jgi:C4-dicarboxylate transporter, DctM subunit
MPIGFTFALVGFLGFVFLRDLNQALGLLGLIPYSWASTYTLVVLPLYILMGQFAFQSGVSADLYKTGYKWVGRMPGGLALATMVACTGFAACSGSSLASAATMSIVAIPEMKKYNYNLRLAAGCVAAGGTLGILIPPSIIFIIFGLMTETSVGKLFIAGILPGLLLSSLFMILIYVLCRRNPKLGPPGPNFSWRERIISLKNVWGMLSLFILVVGGIYFGIFTATEAGAIGAGGAFFLTLIKRQLTWGSLLNTLKNTVRTTAMIFMIVIGAQIFNSFLVISGIPTTISKWIADLPFPPFVILSAVLLIYIPLGMIMDSLPMILLTLPTFFPVITNLGYDPIYFGVLVVLMCEMANISPPMGMNLFIVKGVAPDIPLEDIARGIIPFFIVMVICVVILMVFPQISLFLPALMK